MDIVVIDGKVLDFVCGTGSASVTLLKKGFSIFPEDASLEMIKVAESLVTIKARKISFDEIHEHNCYHAIWVNFILLHTKNISLVIYSRYCFLVPRKRASFFLDFNEGRGKVVIS